MKLEDHLLRYIQGYPNKNTKEIAGASGLPLSVIRRGLKSLRLAGKVKWWADWYGRNAGYCRRYYEADRRQR